ncbi:MAG: integrase core domain-containing protein [Woeseiaceae bacterium]|nr:integrase core domain-containing protein [Woeseiaceae bacterium]
MQQDPVPAEHRQEIRACDLFTVQTLWFRTIYVFFVIHHGTRKLVHARVTAQPNSQWLAQQILEAYDLSTERPRYLIHDRDSSFGAIFDRRVKSLETSQIRTPVTAPRANSIAERWIRSIRNECLDHRLVLGHEHLQRTIDQYIDYYNRWRPHRSLGQSPPRAPPTQTPGRITGNVTAQPILGGLHHVYQWAACIVWTEFLRPTRRKSPG